MNRYTQWTARLGVMVVVIGCAGCATDRVGKHFGDSVRNMIELQSYEPGIDKATPPLDGGRAAEVLKNYRHPKAEPVSVDAARLVSGQTR